jgi:outer membrane protein assembly factor BamB
MEGNRMHTLLRRLNCLWVASAAPLMALVSVLIGCGPSSGQQSVTRPVTIADAAEKEKGIGDFPRLSADRDWPWWRGPSRSGIAPASASPPTHFSETDNVVWKSPIPGRGHSSPVIVGDRIYLTTADDAKQTQSVVAYELTSGEQLWTTETSRGGFPGNIHSKNTHATPTVACDGERLFAAFFHHETVQATALDLDGNKLWQITAGPFNPQRYEYGYAPSPVIYRGLVIIAAEYDGNSFLAAFNRADGKEIWRTKRPENISYSTPSIAHVGGRDQLLISGADQVASYDPNSGKLLWSVKGTTAATCGTVVWDGDTVFASGGYPGSETIAIAADGSGNVLWRNNQRCYEQSMLAADGHLYALTGNGVVYCWRASDGEEMWNTRLGGPVSASPVLAGGHIYWANEKGTMFVFKPNPERFELVARNELGTDSFASPAVSGNRLFLRVAFRSGAKRDEFLYCLGNP